MRRSSSSFLSLMLVSSVVLLLLFNGSQASSSPSPSPSKTSEAAAIVSSFVKALVNSLGSLFPGVIPPPKKIRKYELRIHRLTASPDGVSREILGVNGAPGWQTTISAELGETLQIRVINDLTDSPTALHWHGIFQKDTPFFDGASMVTQCPIPPGAELTYEFTLQVLTRMFIVFSPPLRKGGR